MKLTPLEIRQISFEKSLRGYSCSEVDDFIESLSDDLEQLVKESADDKERLQKQEKMSVSSLSICTMHIQSTSPEN